MLIDAAIEGQGVALARSILAASDLIAGRLVRPFRAAIALRNTYWIVCPKATRALPKIVAFRDWLFEEVAADRHSLASTAATRQDSIALPLPSEPTDTGARCCLVSEIDLLSSSEHRH
jgi:LysR family glycine cleavage system transcriptional activator